MISLVADTIDKKDVNKLIKWLKTYPKITKGEQTIEFEQKWSNLLNRHSIFVNSGSSANLLMVYSLLCSNKIKSKNVIVPAVSWSTTVSPLIQLGLIPILCDCDVDNLSIDLNHFEELCIKYHPDTAIIVNVLGFPSKYQKIKELQQKYNLNILEDSCECVGSTCQGIESGQFGLLSSFSTFFSHHFSTGEGGIVCTGDKDLYNTLLKLRSHGWIRDLNIEEQQKIKEELNIDDFSILYTFFEPGFNLRNTDIAAFLGNIQLKKLNKFIKQRNKNFVIYQENIKNNYWKINTSYLNDKDIISNFAYPIIHPNRKNIINKLLENNIECRPLICGSIGKQPFYTNRFGECSLPFADIVHNYGLYIPNHPFLKEKEILKICSIINQNT